MTEEFTCCPHCGSEDIDYYEEKSDGTQEVSCRRCGWEGDIDELLRYDEAPDGYLEDDEEEGN